MPVAQAALRPVLPSALAGGPQRRYRRPHPQPSIVQPGPALQRSRPAPARARVRWPVPGQRQQGRPRVLRAQRLVRRPPQRCRLHCGQRPDRQPQRLLPLPVPQQQRPHRPEPAAVPDAAASDADGKHHRGGDAEHRRPTRACALRARRLGRGDRIGRRRVHGSAGRGQMAASSAAGGACSARRPSSRASSRSSGVSGSSRFMRSIPHAACPSHSAAAISRFPGLRR